MILGSFQLFAALGPYSGTSYNIIGFALVEMADLDQSDA